MFAHPTANASKQEYDGRAGLYDLAKENDSATVIPIRYLPYHQGQQHHRNELCEADEPEAECVPGKRVHLPSDRYGEHLESSGGKHSGNPVISIIRNTIKGRTSGRKQR